jgi:hypothetical protein
MPETMCKKCGSDLEQGSEHCTLCDQNLRMRCPDCDFISDILFHTDCANAELLVR